ncbi:MAG: hypothetical protein G01um101416_235 [Microgenomates group bacterium Gr01-1014_16]|nr:MAG: hypothetical protein G01um101416_235 [Microgenomates group bacterium Gr01-1014_16]
MIAVFEVGESVGRRVDLDSGCFGEWGLIQPNVDMACFRQGKVRGEELDGKFVTGKDLAFGGGENNQIRVGC